MLQKIIMPKLGDTMEEGLIANWLIKKGDTVNKGDIIMEVETDKAALEVESLVEGRILRIEVQAGQTVPIGTIVAYAGNEDDILPEETAQTITVKQPAGSGGLTSPRSEIDAPRTESKAGRKRASPRAAELAHRLGIDISEVSGTGPGGRITSKDVQNFHESRGIKNDNKF